MMNRISPGSAFFNMQENARKCKTCKKIMNNFGVKWFDESS